MVLQPTLSLKMENFDISCILYSADFIYQMNKPLLGAWVQRGSAAGFESLPVRHQPRHADRHQGQLLLC